MRARTGKPAQANAERLRPANRKATNNGSTHRRAGEIMEAAARVFAERGYHGASTQDIADLLGIRQASLYYYFPSKEVALEQVCMQGVAGFYETEQAIAAGPGTPQEKLAGLVRAHIAPLLDRSHFVRVFLTQRQFLPTPSRRRIGKVSRAIEGIFESVIHQGIRDSAFRADADPRLATLAILGMCNAVPAWYGKENASMERIAGEFVALALRGLATPGAKTRRR